MHKRQNSKRMSTTARDKALGLGDAIPDQTAGKAKDRFVPQTELGRRLWKIRERILISGQPLLGWEQIEQDLLERRGERVAEV